MHGHLFVNLIRAPWTVDTELHLGVEMLTATLTGVLKVLRVSGSWC